jgi:hypothetical protein
VARGTVDKADKATQIANEMHGRLLPLKRRAAIEPVI